jgi:hypothetical protein
VVNSHAEVGVWSPFDLRAPYARSGPMLQPWLADAQINRDRSLRLMYIAGLGLNLYQNVSIYDDMLRYRRVPNALFTGSLESRAYLRELIEQPEG